MNTPIPLNFSDLLDNIVIPEHNLMQDAQRVFHGRGHAFKDLNHITIDWLQPLLLITLFDPVDEAELSDLAEQLSCKYKQCESIQVQHRYQVKWHVDCIFGHPISKLKVIENSLRYQLDIKSGANTGLFLDMKNGRNWIRNHSQKKRVLNLFSYTCGFSVAAAEGGASSVFNIDMSSSFLNIGRENHRLNQHNLKSIRFEKLNILKSFSRIKKQAPYDLIICDPPTFQKGSINLVRDYPKLIRRIKEFLSKDGKLFLCINTPNFGSLNGREFLLKVIKEEAEELEIIDDIKPPKVYLETQNKGTHILILQKSKSTD